MQLELFPRQLEDDIEDLKERYEKLRKSQHARISMLQKDIKDLKSEVDFLKANICKGLLL